MDLSSSELLPHFASLDLISFPPSSRRVDLDLHSNDPRLHVLPFTNPSPIDVKRRLPNRTIRKERVAAAVSTQLGVSLLVEDREIVFVRLGQRVVAFGSQCPHRGAPLEKGKILLVENPNPTSDLEDLLLECPMHHWTWKLSDGTFVPSEETRRYPKPCEGPALENFHHCGVDEKTQKIFLLLFSHESKLFFKRFSLERLPGLIPAFVSEA